MKALRTTLILAVMGIVALVVVASQGASTPSPAQNGPRDASESQLINVLSPKSGEKLTTNFVEVKFELKNPGAAGNVPNYRIQLDSNDPVDTTSTDYTFTGLTNGNHRVSVTMVDANNVPITGSRVEVQFSVAQPPPAQGSVAEPGAVQKAALADPNQDSLPPASSSLPLLSVIGFGVLLGGIASALKTR